DVSEDISIVVNNDATDEADETILMEIDTGTISAAAQAGIQLTHTHTIIDNDSAPTINFGVADSSETEENVSKDIVVELSNESEDEITVGYRLRTTGGSGTA